MFSRKFTLSPEKIRKRNELAREVTTRCMLERQTASTEKSYAIFTDTSKMHRKADSVYANSYNDIL